MVGRGSYPHRGPVQLASHGLAVQAVLRRLAHGEARHRLRGAAVAINAVSVAVCNMIPSSTTQHNP